MGVEPVVLEGRVVRLEPVSDAHIPGLVAAATEDRRSYEFTWVPSTEAEFATYVDTCANDLAAARGLAFAVVALGRVVGATRFLDIEYFPRAWAPPGERLHDDDDPRAVEIGGTWYAASAQRTAVNTEAKLLLLTHAFETWSVARVSFKTDARNVRSRAAIERVGATFEGVRRVHTLAADGSLRDSAYFSIVDAEWPAVRQRLERRLDG